MSALLKPTPTQNVQHPARPARGPLDMKSAFQRLSKRYPKILAKLAE